jgi:antitoxin ParD1/3/4
MLAGDVILASWLSELPMTININLTPQLEAMVRDKVASGRYGSASEVVREALRLMQEHDDLRALKLDALRADIRAGIESGSAGALDVAAIKRKGRDRLTKATKR